MTAAKNKFDDHLSQCFEAITIHEFLEGNGYTADFGLRFVWVATVSALDHYVTELVIEKATQQFSGGTPLSAKLLNEGMPLHVLLKMQAGSNGQSVVEFRAALRNLLRFKTFQKADDLADGLAYIWREKHKWEKIAESVRLPVKSARGKLNSICTRRDLIAHNADFNEATDELMPCSRIDAKEVVDYISKVTGAIESLIP